MHVGGAQARATFTGDQVRGVGLELSQETVVAPGVGDVVEHAGDVLIAKLRPGGHGAVVGHAMDLDGSLHAEEHGVQQYFAAAFGIVDLGCVSVGQRREDSRQTGSACLVAAGAVGHVHGLRRSGVEGGDRRGDGAFLAHREITLVSRGRRNNRLRLVHWPRRAW